MIKKSAAVLVLALFILSIVPMAFAEDAAVGTDVNSNVNSDDGSINADVGAGAQAQLGTPNESEKKDNPSEDQKETSKDSFKDQKEAFKGEKDSFKGDLKEFKGQIKEQRDAMREKFKDQREFTKEQIDQMRERMKEAKDNYQHARERYDEEKGNLKDLRDQFRSCKEDDTSENCAQVRKEINLGVKTHLDKTIELIDNSLTRLIEHVNSSTVLTEQDKQSALDSINTLELRVTAEKEKAVALGDNVSKEDIKAMVKEFKQLWQDVSKQQRRIVAMLTSSKLDNLVEKQKEIADSMQKRIDTAKAKSLDTTELELILVQFKTAVSKTDADQNTARAFWQQTEDVSKENMEKWHDAQGVVREDVRDSRDLLREFVHQYQKLTKPTTAKTEANGAANATVQE